MTAIDGYRAPGGAAFFEYHCWESPQSADAELWYRSQQPVTVLGCVNLEYAALSQRERFESGHQLVYLIQFADDWRGEAFEDELLDSEQAYQRPPPPRQGAKA